MAVVVAALALVVGLMMAGIAASVAIHDLAPLLLASILCGIVLLATSDHLSLPRQRHGRRRRARR